MAADTVDELIALANKNPQPLAMANAGPGSMFPQVGERFVPLLDTEFVRVPYRGSAPARGDRIGGQVDLMFTLFAGPVPATIADGKVKVLGLAVDKPLAKFPKVAGLAAHPKLAELARIYQAEILRYQAISRSINLQPQQ